MSHDKSQIRKFPLLPFSQLVYEMTRWYPSVYMQHMELRVAGGAECIERWQRTLETAFRNHPVFSSRIDRRVQQYSEPAESVLKGKYHRVTLQAKGDDLLIDGYISRILGDGTSLVILMDDIRRAYNEEQLPNDDYWGYLEYVERQKQSEQYRISREWLISEFSDESVPVHPTLDRHLWTLFPPKVGVYKTDYSDLHESVYRFAKEHILSLDCFFSLCAALAIAEYCGTDAAALTFAYAGRERPEEQRVFGSLHRDIPFQIKNLKSEKIVPFKGKEIRNQKSDLIRQARNQIRSGIAHSDYPYTLTTPYNKRWNYAVNVLRVEDEYELAKILPQPVELVPSSFQKYAYALLDVEIHETYEHLSLVYRYSATHYKESSVRRFAALVRKYAEWLLKK